MKKTIAFLMMMVMVLTMAGCSIGGTSSGGSNADLPSDFSTWTDKEMVSFMKAEGVFTDDDLLDVQSVADEIPVGITKLISYIDDYGDADIMIFWLETNGPTARTEEIYNEIKTTHTYIMTELDNIPCPFNLLLGRFAILYSTSLDNSLVEKMETAIEKLISEYNVDPDFYDKDPEMPEYDDYYEDGEFDDVTDD